MIHAVETTAFMLSQKIGETRSQEELAALIRAQNERETTMTAAKPKTTSIPANVKQPQDRQAPAQDGPKDVTIEWHGHSYTIPGDAFDDLELMLLFAEQDAGTLSDQEAGLKMMLAGKRMLGAEQFNEYLKNERGENGRAKTSEFMPFFQHIMEEAGRKNS